MLGAANQQQQPEDQNTELESSNVTLTTTTNTTVDPVPKKGRQRLTIESSSSSSDNDDIETTQHQNVLFDLEKIKADIQSLCEISKSGVDDDLNNNINDNPQNDSTTSPITKKLQSFLSSKTILGKDIQNNSDLMMDADKDHDEQNDDDQEDEDGIDYDSDGNEIELAKPRTLSKREQAELLKLKSRNHFQSFSEIIPSNSVKQSAFSMSNLLAKHGIKRTDYHYNNNDNNNVSKSPEKPTLNDNQQGERDVQEKKESELFVFAKIENQVCKDEVGNDVFEETVSGDILPKLDSSVIATDVISTCSQQEQKLSSEQESNANQLLNVTSTPSQQAIKLESEKILSNPNFKRLENYQCSSDDYNSDDDVELEIIPNDNDSKMKLKHTPKKPNILDFNRQALLVAQEQSRLRREQEMKEREAEIEEKKRKRNEKRLEFQKLIEQKQQEQQNLNGVKKSEGDDLVVEKDILDLVDEHEFGTDSKRVKLDEECDENQQENDDQDDSCPQVTSSRAIVASDDDENSAEYDSESEEAQDSDGNVIELPGGESESDDEISIPDELMEIDKAANDLTEHVSDDDEKSSPEKILSLMFANDNEDIIADTIVPETSLFEPGATQSLMSLLSGTFPSNPAVPCDSQMSLRHESTLDDPELLGMLSGNFSVESTQQNNEMHNLSKSSSSFQQPSLNLNTALVNSQKSSKLKFSHSINDEEVDKATPRIQRIPRTNALFVSDEDEESNAENDAMSSNFKDIIANAIKDDDDEETDLLQKYNIESSVVAASPTTFYKRFESDKQNGVSEQVKSKFIEGEAEVEEDEFMNYGGIDGEDFAGIDEYDKSMLADGEKIKLNSRAIMELHQQQALDKDQKDITDILNDVTSGALRKRRGKRFDPNGKGLDLYDSDEENEALLRQIRKRMGLSAAARKKGEEGALQTLASNPKTQAFAKCFDVDMEKHHFLSSDEYLSDDENIQHKVASSTFKDVFAPVNNPIVEDDEDDDIDDDVELEGDENDCQVNDFNDENHNSFSIASKNVNERDLMRESTLQSVAARSAGKSILEEMRQRKREKGQKEHEQHKSSKSKPAIVMNSAISSSSTRLLSKASFVNSGKLQGKMETGVGKQALDRSNMAFKVKQQPKTSNVAPKEIKVVKQGGQQSLSKLFKRT